MSGANKLRPVSLRISVTDRCQLRCVYCMPADGVPKLPHDEILTFEEMTRFAQALQSRFDVRKIRVTGGEPLARRGIVDLVSMLAKLGVCDIALTTNGQMLAEMARDLKVAGLRRVNVSVDSASESVYRSLTRGGELSKTIAGIREALRNGLEPLKINCVVVRGYNENEVADVARFGFANRCQVRFLELMPIGCASVDFSRRFVPVSEIRARLESSFLLTSTGAEICGSSRNFVAVDRGGLTGTVGFISSESEPFCAGCSRLRLTSTGHLIPCLARKESVSVRHLLRDESPDSREKLLATVARALEGKSVRASFETTRAMSAVGG